MRAGRGTSWSRGTGRRGAESLEFAVGLMLLLGVLVIGVRSVQALRLQAEADADARTLARQAAVCESGRPAALDLRRVDPAAPASASVDPSRGQELVTVTVRFPAVTIVGLEDGGPVTWAPVGTATMRREPACS